MGLPGTELEDQAGIRGLDPGKSIWSTHLPADQTDIAVDAGFLRQATATHRSSISSRSEQADKLRYECSAGATVRAPGSSYPFRVQIKTIHLGGIEVDSITTLPLNTVVNLEMQIEGIQVESAGMVIGSTPRVGMEISFSQGLAGNSAQDCAGAAKAQAKGLGRRAGPAPGNDSRWPISGHDPKSGSSGPY
jgi:hypothetical protein